MLKRLKKQKNRMDNIKTLVELVKDLKKRIIKLEKQIKTMKLK